MFEAVGALRQDRLARSHEFDREWHAVVRRLNGAVGRRGERGSRDQFDLDRPTSTEMVSALKLSSTTGANRSGASDGTGDLMRPEWTWDVCRLVAYVDDRSV